MDERLQELKTRKKACKRAKRKHVTLWKVLSLCFGVLAIVMTIAAPLSVRFDNVVASYLGGSFHTLVDPTDAVYPDVKVEIPEETVPEGMPTLGAQNGLKLYDMMGLDYDDPMWDSLLDQLTYEDLLTLCLDTFGWRMPVESVHAPGAADPQSRGCPCFNLRCFAKYEEDAAAVNKLRMGAHRELYKRLNSSMMNGMGPDTTVKVELLLWVRIFHWAAAGLWLLTLVFVVFWICGKRKWKRTPAYLDYKTIRNVMKMEKKSIV